MKKKEEKDMWRMWAVILYLCLALQILFIIIAYTLPSFINYIDYGLPGITPQHCGVTNSIFVMEVITDLAILLSLILFLVRTAQSSKLLTKGIVFLAIFLLEIFFFVLLHAGVCD